MSAKCIDKTTEMLSKLGKGGQVKISHRLKIGKVRFLDTGSKVLQRRNIREKEKERDTGVLQCAVLSGRRLQ